MEDENIVTQPLEPIDIISSGGLAREVAKKAFAGNMYENVGRGGIKRYDEASLVSNQRGIENQTEGCLIVVWSAARLGMAQRRNKSLYEDVIRTSLHNGRHVLILCVDTDFPFTELMEVDNALLDKRGLNSNVYDGCANIMEEYVHERWPDNCQPMVTVASVLSSSPGSLTVDICSQVHILARREQIHNTQRTSSVLSGWVCGLLVLVLALQWYHCQGPIPKPSPPLPVPDVDRMRTVLATVTAGAAYHKNVIQYMNKVAIDECSGEVNQFLKNITSQRTIERSELTQIQIVVIEADVFGNKELFIGFEGTHGIVDFTTNLDRERLELEKGEAAHAHYTRLARSVRGVRNVLKAIHDEMYTAIHLCGHSRGGAVATLFVEMLFRDSKVMSSNTLLDVYTFGAPLVGNPGLARRLRELHAKRNGVFFHFWNDGDMVVPVFGVFPSSKLPVIFRNLGQVTKWVYEFYGFGKTNFEAFGLYQYLIEGQSKLLFVRREIWETFEKYESRDDDLEEMHRDHEHESYMAAVFKALNVSRSHTTCLSVWNDDENAKLQHLIPDILRPRRERLTGEKLCKPKDLDGTESVLLHVHGSLDMAGFAMWGGAYLTIGQNRYLPNHPTISDGLDGMLTISYEFDVPVKSLRQPYLHVKIGGSEMSYDVTLRSKAKCMRPRNVLSLPRLLFKASLVSSQHLDGTQGDTILQRTVRDELCDLSTAILSDSDLTQDWKKMSDEVRWIRLLPLLQRTGDQANSLLRESIGSVGIDAVVETLISVGKNKDMLLQPLTNYCKSAERNDNVVDSDSFHMMESTSLLLSYRITEVLIDEGDRIDRSTLLGYFTSFLKSSFTFDSQLSEVLSEWKVAQAIIALNEFYEASLRRTVPTDLSEADIIHMERQLVNATSVHTEDSRYTLKDAMSRVCWLRMRLTNPTTVTVTGREQTCKTSTVTALTGVPPEGSGISAHQINTLNVRTVDMSSDASDMSLMIVDTPGDIGATRDLQAQSMVAVSDFVILMCQLESPLAADCHRQAEILRDLRKPFIVLYACVLKLRLPDQPSGIAKVIRDQFNTARSNIQDVLSDDYVTEEVPRIGVLWSLLDRHRFHPNLVQQVETVVRQSPSTPDLAFIMTVEQLEERVLRPVLMSDHLRWNENDVEAILRATRDRRTVLS